MKHFLLFSSLFVSSFFGFSQQLKTKNLVRTDDSFINSISKARSFSPNGIVRCATTEYLKSKQSRGLAPTNEAFEAWLAPKIKEIRKQRSQGRLPAVIRIPVVVHVIHNGDAVGTGENIADGQVLSQITVLNQDFRKLSGTPGDGAGVDTTIEFCLAVVDPNGNPTNGIDRRNLGIESFQEADVEAAKAVTIWDPTKYLNMWSFRFGGDLEGVLGYAQFPTGSGLIGLPSQDCITGEASTDGVVCGFGSWGSRDLFPTGSYEYVAFDTGRTMTHEVGHMLGLRHIWGDVEDPCSLGTTNVATNLDFCADTPVSAGPTFGCPTGTDSCPAIPGLDQIQNYMDYSNHACMNMFTQEQKDRMLAVLMNSPRRDDLLVSTVCNTPQATIQFKRLTCESRVQKSNKIEGNGCSFMDYIIPLNINKAPTANAIVTFTIDGASTADSSDFSIMTPTLTFNSGSTADQNLIVRVYNDAYIESVESIIINFTVNANGGDALANPEGNKLTFSILNDDIAPATTFVNTILTEDFDDLAGWTQSDTDEERWFQIDREADGIGTPPNTIVGSCVVSEKSRTFLGGTGNATPNNYLISPQVTIPSGAVAVDLSYIMAGAGATAGNYTVYFATNVSTEANILSGTVLQAPTTIASDASVLRNHSLLSLAGQTGYIVFRHSNLNTATGLLLLDSVLLTSTVNTNIQTAVNATTNGNNNLNNAGTATFYDSVARNIMSGITVNSASDFGCTSVAVTRSGTSALQYGSSTNAVDFAMSKQFTITPASNVSGNATITFYFTAAEIAGWEAATGNNRTLLYVVRDGITREIQPVTIGSFGTGVTLTATFTGGVQGVYSFARQQSLPTNSFEFDEIGLYPNPNNGTFNIQFTPLSEKINVVVFDLRGRVIFDKQYQNNGLFNESIQLDNVESGVYLVKIQDGSRKIVKKIIVE